MKENAKDGAAHCAWTWDEENGDYMTACRRIYPAFRRKCQNCGKPVKEVAAARKAGV